MSTTIEKGGTGCVEVNVLDDNGDQYNIDVAAEVKMDLFRTINNNVALADQEILSSDDNNDWTIGKVVLNLTSEETAALAPGVYGSILTITTGSNVYKIRDPFVFELVASPA